MPRGNTTRATSPPPSRAARSNRPPCIRAMRSTIASPSPEPPVPLRAVVESRERLLQALDFLGRDARTAIEHFDAGAAVGRHDAQRDLATGVTQRVVEQIRDQPPDRERPESQRRYRLELLAGAVGRPRDSGRQSRARVPSRSSGSAGSPAAARAKSRNWPMMRSMSSMSAAMPGLERGVVAAPSSRARAGSARAACADRAKRRRGAARARRPAASDRAPSG